MTRPAAEHEAALEALLRASPALMQALQAARSLGLRSWCIGAGVIRNLVWDALHGHVQATEPADVDLAYFEADEPVGREHEHQAVLAARCPGVPWEVTNQAHVHHWFEQHFGHAVGPLQSLHEAVASWPEYATAVGVSLDEAGALHILAPWGLDDLFAMRVRRNPVRVSRETYLQRVASKQYRQRWPRVEVFIEPA